MQSKITQIKRLEEIFEKFHDPIIIVDKNCLIVDLNNAAIKALNSTKELLQASNLFDHMDLCFDNHTTLINDQVINCINQRTLLERNEETIFLKPKKISSEINPDINKAVEIILFHYTLENQNESFLVIHDLSEARKEAQKLYQRASYDYLTHLLNRESFLDRLDHAIAYASRYFSQFAVLFVDLDDFKQINDKLGHAYGDKFLQESAKQLSACIRSSDTLARLGGDEFVILLSQINSSENCAKVAKNILDVFSAGLKIDQGSVAATASIGIAIYPSDGLSKEELLANADKAMYHAKKNGKNKYEFFKKKLNRKISKHFKLLEDFSRGMEKEEFILYFQPEFNIATDKIQAFEALIRWNHPDLGMMMPKHFIPLAESNNLINQLGEFIIKKACTTLQNWKNNGIENIKIAINLSIRQLYDDKFINKISTILSEHSISPKQIQLEITESIFLKDTRKLVKNLEKLHEIGLTFALDDFGLGYSCIGFLSKLPLDAIKIDKSLIQSIPLDKDNSTIVLTILAMAKELHLNAIAEGVSNIQQLNFLKSSGCKFAQGFLIGKPLSTEDTLTYIQNHTDYFD